MGKPALEVADIFRAHGPAWRTAQRGHLSLGQSKVMVARLGWLGAHHRHRVTNALFQQVRNAVTTQAGRHATQASHVVVRVPHSFTCGAGTDRCCQAPGFDMSTIVL